MSLLTEYFALEMSLLTEHYALEMSYLLNILYWNIPTD
jgi:hypothetical protein